MGAYPVAQESAGEVIKENGSLGGRGKNLTMDFIFLLETSHLGSCTHGFAHTQTDKYEST